MTYPDTDLRSDTLDADYGGRPGSEFGGLAWSWVNSVLLFLEQAFLTYQRAPYVTVVAISEGAAAAGDVAVFSPDQVGPLGIPYVARYNMGMAAPRILGIYLEPCSGASKARIAVAGLVPSMVTGLGTIAAPADAGLNAGTGRVRVAVPGDVVLGRIDLAGNVLFTGHGSAV